MIVHGGGQRGLKGIVTVAAWTGLRKGNILRLRRNQVNIFARTISLDDSEMINEEPLIIPIVAPAHEALKEALRVAHLNSQVVFCHADRKPYTSMQVQRAFKEALKSAEIDNFCSMISGTASHHGAGRRGLISILSQTC